MTEDPEEVKISNRRIDTMCAVIEHLGQDNGNGREYLAALTLCIGRYLYAMPDPAMREKTLQQFTQALQHLAKGRKP